MMVSMFHGNEADGVTVALALCGLGLLAFMFSRANGARRSFSSGRRQDEIDLVVLHRIVETASTRTILWFAACFACELAVVALDADVLLPLPIAFLLVGIGRARRLGRLAALRADGTTRVVSDGHFLFGARDKTLVGWVAASPACVARARQLPIARLRSTSARR